MFVRALFAFLVLPGVVAGLIPALIVYRGGNLHDGSVTGLVVGAVGLGLLLWCVRDFFVSGKGTLAPWDPPKHLVVIGLYRFVRNPMYVAVLTTVLGWGVAFHSAWVGLYLLLLAIGFHLRAVLYEEPWLRRQFGAEWEVYSTSVPRWLPRLRFGKRETSS